MGDPWFKEGLRFKCTECGKCCTGSPGYVYLSQTDLSKLAEHFKLSEEVFTKEYTRVVDGQLALIDRPQSDACVFLKEEKCSVYTARPTQCKTFPWWLHTLRSKKSWNEAAKDCEGINHPDAPIISGVEIAKQCTTYLDNLVEQNFAFSPHADIP